METIKFLDVESSRIDKIEEVINTLGTNFSSIEIKKEETPAKEEPKFVYVPKVPRTKHNPPIAKRVETVKTSEETPILNKFINETPIDLPPFDFIPKSILLGLYLEDLLRLVVLLKSFLMILMMVHLIQFDPFALCLAQRRKRKRLLGGNPICFSFCS